MEPITAFTGKVVALPIDNIDTDQVIPARFLRATDKAGMGDALFADWRYDAEGKPKPDFVLNQPEARGAQVLIAGNNFGCGSSREHAAWALAGYGFRAVVSTEIADIFRNNALKVGLLPIIVDQVTYEQLVSMVGEDPQTAVTIDLATQTLQLAPNQAVTFPIDPFAKYCLVNGVDQLGFLQAQGADTEAYEAEHGARVTTNQPAL